LGQYQRAIAAYERYLGGFEKLRFVPQDHREIRKKGITCDELFAIRQDDERTHAKNRQLAEARLASAKQVEQLKAEKVKFIREHGRSVIAVTVTTNA
jgi:hypothetical protein